MSKTIQNMLNRCYRKELKRCSKLSQTTCSNKHCFKHPSGTVDTQNCIPFELNSDSRLVTLITPPDQKDVISVAESRFEAFQKLNLPGLSVQGHAIEPLRVERDPRVFQMMFKIYVMGFSIHISSYLPMRFTKIFLSCSFIIIPAGWAKHWSLHALPSTTWCGSKTFVFPSSFDRPTNGPKHCEEGILWCCVFGASWKDLCPDFVSSHLGCSSEARATCFIACIKAQAPFQSQDDFV